MRILLTGGGTGGHVTPLIAVASSIAKNSSGVHIRYVGKRGDSASLISDDNKVIEKQYRIFAGKLRRFHGKSLFWYLTQPALIIRNIRDALLFLVGCLESLIILIKWRPSVVFVKGGYVGLPVGIVATFLRIPIVTHDSDAWPGLTNRILSRFASAVCVGMPIEGYPQYAGLPLYHTGVPVRDEFVFAPDKKEARRKLKIPVDAQVIAVTGGSLGATRINEAVMRSMKKLTNSSRVIIWITGSAHFREVNDYVSRNFQNSAIQIMKYSDDMVSVLVASDVVITRAGATTLAELSLLKKPAVIVPNPYLTGGHQVKNANIYSKRKAALVLTESNLKNNPDVLSDAINDIFSKQELANELSESIYSLSVSGSANKIASIILRVASKSNV